MPPASVFCLMSGGVRNTPELLNQGTKVMASTMDRKNHFRKYATELTQSLEKKNNLTPEEKAYLQAFLNFTGGHRPVIFQPNLENDPNKPDEPNKPNEPNTLKNEIKSENHYVTGYSTHSQADISTPLNKYRDYPYYDNQYLKKNPYYMLITPEQKELLDKYYVSNPHNNLPRLDPELGNELREQKRKLLEKIEKMRNLEKSEELIKMVEQNFDRQMDSTLESESNMQIETDMKKYYHQETQKFVSKNKINKSLDDDSE